MRGVAQLRARSARARRRRRRAPPPTGAAPPRSTTSRRPTPSSPISSRARASSTSAPPTSTSRGSAPGIDKRLLAQAARRRLRGAGAPRSARLHQRRGARRGREVPRRARAPTAGAACSSSTAAATTPKRASRCSRSGCKVWLTRGRIGRGVLAFCTARPTDGGAGAVYVLLAQVGAASQPRRVAASRRAIPPMRCSSPRGVRAPRRGRGRSAAHRDRWLAPGHERLHRRLRLGGDRAASAPAAACPAPERVCDRRRRRRTSRRRTAGAHVSEYSMQKRSLTRGSVVTLRRSSRGD